MHQVEKRRKFISQVVGKIIPMACQRRELLKSVEMHVEICEGGLLREQISFLGALTNLCLVLPASVPPAYWN